MPPSPKTKLVIERTSQTMAEGGFASTMNRLLKGELLEHTRKAQAWVDAAIALVRTALDADPKWTDDEIAQRILDAINEKRKELTRATSNT